MIPLIGLFLALGVDHLGIQAAAVLMCFYGVRYAH